MKYFYRDVIKAIWMEKHFKIPLYKEDLKRNWMPGELGIQAEKYTYYADDEKYYIHSDYHEILIPQIGDLVLFGNGNVKHWIYDSEYYIDPKNGIKIKYNWQEIIQRNDKAFFMPESEV